MGWSGGSQLAEDVWALVRDYIPKGNERRKIARKIVDLFESHDCDTLDEAEDLCKDTE